MNIKQKLEFLKAYYEFTRNSGHSTLMRKGTDRYKRNKLVLTYTKECGFDFGLKPHEIVSWRNLNDLVGHSSPLAIDNAAMFKMLEETVEYINELEQYKEQINEIKKIITIFLI